VSQWAYLTALAITLVCEAPLVVLGYARRVAPARLCGGFVAVNLLTHGLLWLVRPSTTGRVAAAEVMIALVEAGLYARLFGGGARRALAVSVAANALSLAVGIAL
jgi:dipeptide/tripeptide permease